MAEEWNHNIHYHEEVLAAVPAGCERALDVGCGTGLLTRKLAGCAGAVVGIDCEAGLVAGPEFVVGDVMTYSFAAESFGFVTAVATLHHLPLRAGLERLKELLGPGGVLAVVGLYRPAGLGDVVFAAAGRMVRPVLRAGRVESVQSAPMTEPRESLREIREAAAECLHRAVVRRRVLFRYTMVWRKPGG